jgi:hypothetical protein
MQIGAGGRAVPVPFGGGGGAFERQVVPRLRGGCARWGREMRAERSGSAAPQLAADSRTSRTLSAPPGSRLLRSRRQLVVVSRRAHSLPRKSTFRPLCFATL